MADQDFHIKVVTTADTSGLRQTRQEIEALQQKSKDFLAGGPAQTGVEKWIAAQQAAKSAAAAAPVKEETESLRGTALGIGTIIFILNHAINKWREFNAEQDRWVDGMIRAEEKARALGDSIIGIQDAAISARLHGTDTLQESFNRLNQEIIRLKTEQSELNLPEQGEEWKKLNAEIEKDASLLKGVELALQKQRDAAKQKAQSELEKRVPGLKPDDQVKEADAQTQAILKNEQAAAAARAAGNEKDADLFQKSADQYKASATPKQLADLQRIHDLQDQLAGKTPQVPARQPEPGEPGGGEVGTGGERAKSAAQLRADQEQNRKDREAGIRNTGQQDEQARKDRETELENTRKASEQAKRDREAANDKLREQMLEQKPATQTQEDKTYGEQIAAKLDTLIGLFR